MCLFCKQYAYLLSPCLTESACRSKSVEIKGWGKWLCFSWFTQPSEAGWQRRRRRWHAELQRSEVVWERPPCTRRRTRATAPDKEDPPPPLPSSVLYKATWESAHARTRGRMLEHTLSAPALSLGRVFLHLRMMRGEARERACRKMRCVQQISPASHPVGLPSRQTCCQCRPRWRLLLFFRRESWKLGENKRRVRLVLRHTAKNQRWKVEGFERMQISNTDRTLATLNDLLWPKLSPVMTSNPRQ